MSPSFTIVLSEHVTLKILRAHTIHEERLGGPVSRQFSSPLSTDNGTHNRWNVVQRSFFGVLLAGALIVEQRSFDYYYI